MFAWTLLLAALPHGSLSDDLTYSNARYGFAIDRPDETWRQYSQNDVGDAKLALTIYPQGSVGVPGVVVYVAKWDGETSPEALRDQALVKLEAAGASDIVSGTLRIGDVDAPAARSRSSQDGLGDFVLEYAYLTGNGELFVVQRAWSPATSADPPEPESERDPPPRELDAIARSFRTFEPVIETPDPAALAARELAERCGSELSWAASWEEASRRASDEGRLVLAVVEIYRLIEVPRTTPSGVFMDDDVVALLNERFVPFRIEEDTKAPFREPDAFGLGKWTFGTAFLCVDPDGRVLRETGVSNASYLDQFLRGVLADFGPKPKTPGALSEPKTALERAEAAFLRGDLDSAEKALGRDESNAARLLRASILRRQRKGEEALAELRDVPGHFAEKGIVAMRLGRLEEAKAAFERVVAETGNPRAEECEFWLGAFDVLAQGWPNGMERWEKLVAEHPESRWSWKAAANLTSVGAFVHGAERLAWPDEDVVSAVARPEREPQPVAAATKVVDEAVAFLVKSQRADGSWICPMDAFSFDSSLYTPAITALCGMSLLPHASRAGVRDVVRASLDRTLETLDSGQFEASTGIASVYAIWSKTFAMWFVARCVSEDVGDPETLRPALARLVGLVVESQHRGGGWPYVSLPGDDSGSAFDPSASFLTAGVVLALQDAQHAGADVPEEVLSKALDFLARLREKNGSFRYMPDAPNGRVESGLESAGRGPPCALALLRGGRTTFSEVASTLEVFVTEQPLFTRAWHKQLCHTEPQGFGSHYLLYDYWLALEATREVPPAEGEPLRKAILGEMLRHRFEDGSFEDIPGLGRACATGLALLALRDAR